MTETSADISAETTTYRVVAPMIQIVSDYRANKNTALERQFRDGDVLPAWIPADEIQRLMAGGFIEVSE